MSRTLPTSTRRRRRALIRSRARRRSVSICDSPGPLVPMPPSMPPCAEALEVGPQPPHAREVVLELGELDLELALGRVGVVGEDVEDHGGAVDDRHAELLLEVALLARQQLVVAGDQVRVRLLDRAPSAPRACRGRSSGPGRARRRRWTSSPAVATPAVLSSSLSSASGSSPRIGGADPDRERPLARARVDDARDGPVRRLAARSRSISVPIPTSVGNAPAGAQPGQDERRARGPPQADVAHVRERSGRAGVGDRLPLDRRIRRGPCSRSPASAARRRRSTAARAGRA